jgi:antitoxin VapB
MSMNIKNREAHLLASEIATLTGESQTTAVTVALRERLERLRMAQEPGLAERLLAIGRDAAAHLAEPYRSIDHDDLLYDEHGLPR